MAKSTAKSKSKTQKGLIAPVIQGYLAKNASISKAAANANGRIYFIDSAELGESLRDELAEEIGEYQYGQWKEKPSQKFITEEGPVWVLRLLPAAKEFQERSDGKFAPSSYAQTRELLGNAFADALRINPKKLKLEFRTEDQEAVVGGLVGIEMASYNFKAATHNKLPTCKLQVVGAGKKELDQAIALGTGTNIARHLVNLPPNKLYPESYADTIKDTFADFSGVTITIWDEKKLAKEKMNLILAVGSAADFKPRLAHVRYRPAKGSKSKPLVLVGKGITFDSGGLDLKPASNMRLMKKDMGGSAAVVGCLYSLLSTNYNKPLDIYIPLAENAVSGNAFRPGDIVESRSGKTVEIHNTDAEGRLILADALALAKEQKGDHKAKAILSVATLTGAVKVGLGVGMGGYFSSDSSLGSKIAAASQESGDLMWEVPLFPDYLVQLKSQFADINHCSTVPFGGAVTAALFLNEFVSPEVFGHLDIYAWNDRIAGSLREIGGSGQAVQCLYHLISSY